MKANRTDKPLLIIDDEADIRHMLSDFLELEGLPCVLAANGIEGVELFEKHKPDVIITDIRMPGMSGIEVLGEIKSRSPETEVIVITGHGEITLAIEALQKDASDFIQKPFDLETLSIAIKRAQERIYYRQALEETRQQLQQSEKMASLGQLAAGVAHEINNPIGFVHSNLGTLKKYLTKIKSFLTDFEKMISNGSDDKTVKENFSLLKNKNKIDFILADIDNIVDESLEGTDRVHIIVSDLKNFAHIDRKELQEADLNKCIESTLNIIWNELKYHCKVEKKFAELPMILCYPQQINQVLMNLMINAGQAIEDKGVITIETLAESEGVVCRISDTGKGIPPEIKDKIFDPFFTTKDVGKGTGLGLHIVFGIIKKHNGSIKVDSEMRKGTTFTVFLPYKPPLENSK